MFGCSVFSFFFLFFFPFFSSVSTLVSDNISTLSGVACYNEFGEGKVGAVLLDTCTSRLAGS